VARLVSLLLLFLIWQSASVFAGPGVVPEPMVVATTIWREVKSGALISNFSITLLRVAASFLVAMALGTAIGLAMGRNKAIDRLFDPWLIVLLNLPALVVIVLSYIWIGLTEAAAITAVALNKLPLTATTIREGARAFDKDVEEMAFVFRMPFWTRLRHVLIPQLMPYIAAATRAGLSLVWKIVLVVELLGRSNGVGFQIGIAFQLFDVALLLAYALPFVGVMLAVETFLVQPVERYVTRWRPHAA